MPPPAPPAPGRAAEWLGIRDAHTAKMAVLLFSLFVYGFAYHALDVALPFINAEINAAGGKADQDTEVYSQLKAAFGAVQLVGGLLLGRAGDVIGRSAVVATSHLASAVSYGLVASAQTQLVLFLSVLPAAFQQLFQASAGVVTGYSAKRQRIRALGRLWLGYGAGAVLGPLTAGALAAELGPRNTIWMSCAASAGSAVLICAVMHSAADCGPQSACAALCADGSSASPEQDEPGAAAEPEGDPGSLLSVEQVCRLLELPGAGVLLLVKALFAFSRGMVLGLLPQLAVSAFDTQADGLGWLLGYNELVAMVARGLVLSCLDEVFPPQVLVAGSMAACAVSLAVLAFATTAPGLYAGPATASFSSPLRRRRRRYRRTCLFTLSPSFPQIRLIRFSGLSRRSTPSASSSSAAAAAGSSCLTTRRAAAGLLLVVGSDVANIIIMAELTRIAPPANASSIVSLDMCASTAGSIVKDPGTPMCCVTCEPCDHLVQDIFA